MCVCVGCRVVWTDRRRLKHTTREPMMQASGVTLKSSRPDTSRFPEPKTETNGKPSLPREPTPAPFSVPWLLGCSPWLQNIAKEEGGGRLAWFLLPLSPGSNEAWSEGACLLCETPRRPGRDGCCWDKHAAPLAITSSSSAPSPPFPLVGCLPRVDLSPRWIG